MENALNYFYTHAFASALIRELRHIIWTQYFCNQEQEISLSSSSLLHCSLLTFNRKELSVRVMLGIFLLDITRFSQNKLPLFPQILSSLNKTCTAIFAWLWWVDPRRIPLTKLSLQSRSSANTPAITC